VFENEVQFVHDGFLQNLFWASYIVDSNMVFVLRVIVCPYILFPDVSRLLFCLLLDWIS